LTLNSFVYSTGKIDHDILLILGAFILSFSGWGDALSVDSWLKRKGRQTDEARALHSSYALGLYALVIAIAMWKAGWAKLTTGWLSLDTRNTLGFLTLYTHGYGQVGFLGLFALDHVPGWLWKLGDILVVTVEISLLPAWFSRRWFALLCALACAFHLGVWALFDIKFAANVLAYGVLLSYSRLVGWIPGLGHQNNSVAGSRDPGFIGHPPASQSPATILGALFVVIPGLILSSMQVFLIGEPFDVWAGIPIRELYLVAGSLIGAGYLIAVFCSWIGRSAGRQHERAGQRPLSRAA
jgi:hypothetical protein